MLARSILASIALVGIACHSRHVEERPAPALPSPILVFDGDSTYQAQGTNWTQYRLRIANHAAFPDSLFEPAPTLPPCGTNTLASRTWVEIFDRLGRRVYGHCGIARNSGLAALRFARRAGTEMPDSVFVLLVDRKADRSYRSNLVSIRSR